MPFEIHVVKSSLARKIFSFLFTVFSMYMSQLEPEFFSTRKTQAWLQTRVPVAGELITLQHRHKDIASI